MFKDSEYYQDCNNNRAKEKKKQNALSRIKQIWANQLLMAKNILLKLQLVVEKKPNFF